MPGALWLVPLLPESTIPTIIVPARRHASKAQPSVHHRGISGFAASATLEAVGHARYEVRKVQEFSCSEVPTEGNPGERLADNRAHALRKLPSLARGRDAGGFSQRLTSDPSTAIILLVFLP